MLVTGGVESKKQEGRRGYESSPGRSREIAHMAFLLKEGCEASTFFNSQKYTKIILLSSYFPPCSSLRFFTPSPSPPPPPRLRLRPLTPPSPNNARFRLPPPNSLLRSLAMKLFSATTILNPPPPPPQSSKLHPGWWRRNRLQHFLPSLSLPCFFHPSEKDPANAEEQSIRAAVEEREERGKTGAKNALGEHL